MILLGVEECNPHASNIVATYPSEANDPVARWNLRHSDLVDDFEVVRAPRSGALAAGPVPIPSAGFGVLSTRRRELVAPGDRIFGPTATARVRAGRHVLPLDVESLAVLAVPAQRLRAVDEL